ncbi:hypothetical protein BLNAU_18982 [Blattamonas nauphoetae]|uniref:Serine-threonine/tyrosine-protein kinase catalytic domain-containing protein n=1 Tax=Blattamonas nauphoetae TaxID=2049346 RepID=A0ABQ9X424_9EUKA|nr:hypothetical protein BLNAU_18982 [Blattamonas nauphoetae]
MPPHVFLAIPLIVSIIRLTHPAQTIPDASLLNLKPILEELTETRISNIESRNEPIHLHGQYHVLEYVVRSLNISIIGAQSTSIVSSRTEDEQALSNSNPSSMLIVSNSTLALSSLRLICNGDHTSVATISESSLSVSKCKIGAASSTSPFVSTWTPTDNSMLTVVDTQVNWKHATSLPLFGTMPSNHKSLVTESSENRILGRETYQSRGLLSIVGSGLTFSNTAFPLATGPLFDFGFDTNHTQQSLLVASVCLTRSVMTNVTSRRRLISDTVRFNLVSQRVICSSISESTNHLYGTGSLDLNFGSSVCCLNSSFSMCETDSFPTECPPTVYLQHRTTHFDHSLSPAITTFDTCTFRDLSASRGGAIDSLTSGSTLSVTKCSFFRCSADRMGGSIYFRPSPTTCSVDVSHCSFVSGNSGSQSGAIQYSYCQQGSITDCVFYDIHADYQAGSLVLIHSPGPIIVSRCSFTSGTAQFAGAMDITNCSEITFTDCIFYDLNTTGSGGAMIIDECPGITVSNCLFQKCRHVGGYGVGGAIHSENCGFTFKSLRFRENLALSHHRGHDLAIELTEATRDASSFEDCDTDQEDIQIYFVNFNIKPNLVSVSNPLTVSSVSSVVSTDNRTAQVTLTVDRPISGTVLMLVNNTNNYEMPNDNSPPPLSRMISFDFSPDSTSTESTLSFGEWEDLQYEANYSLVTFGWKESIVDTNGAVLTTPNPPRIVRAMCEVGNSEFDAFFSLKARTLATGSYKASVKGKSDFWMVVDFVHNPYGGNIFSTGFGLKLQGEDAILDFETMYEIDEVIEDSTDKVLILDPPRLFFTTPSPPKLKTVGTISFTDTKQDTITIELVGENLFRNPYTVTVSDGSATSTLTAEFDADGVNGETTAVVYSMDDSTPIQLTFGTTYTITDFTCSGNPQPELTPNLQIVVPPEPARIERVGTLSLNKMKTEVTVPLMGAALSSKPLLVTVERSGTTFKSTQTIKYVSKTEVTIVFAADLSESTSKLKYGQTYTVKSVKNDTASFIVNPSISFIVPNPPVVTLITPSLSSNCTDFQMTFSGTGLPLSGTFTATPSVGSVFSVSFSSGSGTSEWINGGGHGKMNFNTTYSLSSAVDADGNHIVLQAKTFVTPEGPTLTDVSAKLKEGDPDSLTLTLTGLRMASGSFNLVVQESGETSRMTIAVSIGSTTSGSGWVEVYKKSGTLEYGKTYIVESLSVADFWFSIPSSISFPTPAEPARVEKVISAILNDAQNEVEVTFQARALPATITSVTITGKDASVFISATRLSDTSFTARFHVAMAASASSLVFGETYSIESVSNGTNFILNTDISFAIPLKPRLIDINTSFSNDVKTGLHFNLTVDGSIHDSKYKLTMNDDIEVEVECSSLTLTCRTTTPLRIGWETGLQYETEHTLSKMEKIGESVHHVDLVKKTFTTHSKPTEPMFHVDETGHLGDFCGDAGDRCKTIDETWRIVKGIGFARPTLLIKDSSTLNSPIVMTQGMHVMVTNGSSTEPKLHVASFELNEGQLGMIVVESAFLELRNVDVHILSATQTFVLIHGTNSELVFRDGLFAGPASGMAMNEDADGVCSWSSGALQLVNCDTHIRTTQLSRLSQGAINMKNGSLDIQTSSFVSNSASSSSFPSSRRNIHCSDEGNITIGSLSGGDGHQGSSLWASMEDCVMDGDAAQPNSPLFVPQLDKEQSMTVMDTDTQQYTVSIVGSRLIPCGLFLEVFEHESVSNADGKSVDFELKNTSSESEVTLVIEADEIAALDQKHELRCRLKFGQNVRTTDWFTFSAAHIDDPEPPEPEPEKPKFSQTPLGKALSWILPLSISVILLLIIFIIVLLVWRRKRQPKQEDKTELAEQESDEYLAKVDVLDSGIDETRNIVAVNQHKAETTNNESTFGVASTANEELVEVIDMNDLANTKYIASKETLYHRLHEAQNPKPIEAEKIQKGLTEQLLLVMQKMPTAQVLQSLNPHWVILGDDATVHFKLVDGQTKNQSFGDKMNSPNGGDAQRWNPPEETEERNESQQKSTAIKEAGLVFRLGLLLWEIETGQVPYREHDALNAHRQIVLGVGLKMNGVENEGLRELIEDCMQIEAKMRPTLQKVNDRLVKCFSPSGSDPTLGQQNHKAESKQ